MKRPPGLWLLLTIVAVWLRVDDVYSLKATALIFGKTSTTTSTATPDASDSINEEVATEASSPEQDTQNSTKPVLTGIPQIDYIYDPNLPRELNGYNLSEYPFYDRVPEEMNFKCDGLHDGFYASVPHKCQVYHHCLYGVRYDFLCANYTAFDQKTFICHFVSEVDCVNSKKFWHRNDALYQAASTTTVKPTVTVPPAPATPVPAVPLLPRRPERPRRPLLRRPRPYDYYEEDYEEEDYYEKPMRRVRPKYRPRVYDDEYEYEEDDYNRRPGGRRNENRRPFSSRGSNRRRPYKDEEYEEEEDSRRMSDNSRRTPDDSRRPSKRRPIEDEEYDRRSYDRPRKKGYRRPADDDYEDDVQPRRSTERRKLKNRDESRKYNDEEEEERPRKNGNRDDRPRKNYDRNRSDDTVEDDKPRNKNDKNEDSSDKERSRKNNENNSNDGASYDDKPLPKPPSSVYDRARPISKVRPPVPAHEQAKYSPKVPRTTTPLPADEDYYDDYEEDIRKKEEPRRAVKDINIRKATTQSSVKRGPENKRKQEDESDDLDVVTRGYKRREYGKESSNRDRRINSNSRRRPVIEEYEDYEEIKNESANDQKTTTTTTKEPPREPVVKIVKRPFLPSRGGNPYASRGLLPIGTKALDASNNQKYTPETQNSKDQDDKFETTAEDDEAIKPSPVIVKIPIRNKHKYDEDFRPISNRPVTRIVKLTTTTTTTTEKPKVVEKNPLDLDENEYDVTLNDALNPTLPNLPIRSFPTGFSSQNDYTYNTVPRSRFVIDPAINQASSDYVYRIEQPEVASSNNIKYKTQNVPVFQSFRQTPRVTQAFYAPY